MVAQSPEFQVLEAIRDWMATLPLWQSWTGLTGDDLKARVVWPIKDAPALPVCVLFLKGGRTINKTGAAGGSNFDPSGMIGMAIYAADTGGEDEATGYTDFGDMFFALKQQMADYAHTAPVLFNEFTTDEIPIVRSSWVNTEEDQEGMAAWWQGVLNCRWGVEQ